MFGHPDLYAVNPRQQPRDQPGVMIATAIMVTVHHAAVRIEQGQHRIKL